MNPGLHCRLTNPDELSRPQREEMFALFSQCYECVTRPAFDQDLADKTGVILLLDGEDRIRGFSTHRVDERTWRGEKVRVLFSGDTIVDPVCWGSAELVKGWCAAAARALAEAPDRRLFWFLISKGYRTYLYLPLFFRRFIPSCQAEAPAEWTELLRALAEEKFGGAWNPNTGLIRFPVSRGQLAPELCGIPAGRVDDPYVRFFLERNPGWREGVELACLTEITLDNTRGPGRRWLAAALKQTSVVFQ